MVCSRCVKLTDCGDYSMLLQSDAVLDNVVYINDYAKKLNYSVTEHPMDRLFSELPI